MANWAWVVVGGLSITVAGLSAATADTIFEVEHARANARAGGPVSAYDAELLDRWGALSGTPGWRRQTSGSGQQGKPARKTQNKRHHDEGRN